ncbi:hypothetical protein HanIR_Chr11g0519631 [Helianthus annuus]|nr:hypothetical protein HanIR_Chr11g0519631 [Helianthus annuus]
MVDYHRLPFLSTLDYHRFFLEQNSRLHGNFNSLLQGRSITIFSQLPPNQVSYDVKL